MAANPANALACSHHICQGLFKHKTAGVVSASQKQSNIPVKPMAVSVQSTICCCTASRMGERGLEVVPDLPDLGLLIPSGESGKGSSWGIASTAEHNTSAGAYKCTSHGGAPLPAQDPSWRCDLQFHQDSWSNVSRVLITTGRDRRQAEWCTRDENPKLMKVLSRLCRDTWACVSCCQATYC